MDLTPNSFDRLNRLKETVEASTYTEVMKDALRLYEYIVEADAKGDVFLTRSANGTLTEVKIFT